MKPTNEPFALHNRKLLTGILNATWLTAVLGAVGYLLYRHMGAADDVVADLARRAGL